MNRAIAGRNIRVVITRVFELAISLVLILGFAASVTPVFR